MGNFYAQDFDPWVHNIRGIGNMLMQMPYQKARIQAQQQLANYRQQEILEQQERMKLMGSQEGEAGARTRLLSDQATDQEGQTESGNRLSDALKRVMQNPKDPAATGDAISEFGHYFKKNPEQAAKGMGDLLSKFMVMQGNTNYAAQGSLQGNAASIANDQANNTRIMATPQVLPANSISVDKTSGQPIAIGNALLHPGETLTQPDETDLTYGSSPDVSGPALPPHSSGVQTARNQAVREILLKETDPLKQQQLIRRYDKQTGYNPPIDVSATVTPAPAVGATTPLSSAASASAPTPQIPVSHISYLLAHPEAAGDFDAKYGPGAAAAVMKNPNGP